MKYVLSLDVGTTSLKGALFDGDGHSLAAHAQEYALAKPGPDIVECDCGVYWDSAQTVIRAILEKSRIAPREVAAVGVTSQGETLTVLDGDGNPLRRSIVWLDNRSHEEADEIGGVRKINRRNKAGIENTGDRADGKDQNEQTNVFLKHWHGLFRHEERQDA